MGGGRNNQAGDCSGAADNADSATVGGGFGNAATAAKATVGGGVNNGATGYAATVGGGAGNGATGNYAAVGGGGNNAATDVYATVGGGLSNQASGFAATVGGGRSNAATGDYSTVGGGYFNTASAAYSFAVGTHANANHVGAFVWGDASTEGEVASTHDHQFLIRASGGTWLYSDPDLTSGVRLTGGSSAMATVSDRNMKANIRQVDSRSILDRLLEIPISRWNYKAQDPDIEHIGPMAQDFYAAFGLDEDDKHISTVDADGVALAAIQGLYELVKEKEAENAELRQRVDDMEARLEALEAAE